MHRRISTQGLVVLFAALSSAPAWAVVDYYSSPQLDPVTQESTGTSFTSTPTLSSANGVAIPASASAGGWNYEGTFGSYAATAIGPNWIATVSHIGFASQFTYNGTTYSVLQNSGVVINPSSQDGSGIELYRITNQDGTAANLTNYAQLWTGSDGSEIHTQAVVTGRGVGGSAVTLPSTGQTVGYYWANADPNNPTVSNVYRLQWGENYVYPTSSGGTSYLAYSFDAPGSGDSTTNEAGLITGDSGGGVYLYSPLTQQWKLAGLNEGIESPATFSLTSTYSNPFTAALFNNDGLYYQSSNNSIVQMTGSNQVGAYFDSSGNYQAVDTTGDIDVSYDVSAAATAMLAAQDFLNTSSYSIGGGTLTFNASSTTTLPVISGNNSLSNNVLFSSNFILAVPAGSTFAFTGNVRFSSGITFASSGAGLLQLKNVRSAGLSITNGTVQIAPSGTASSVSIVNALSISAGGRLDLNNNDLILNYSGSDPTSTIRSYLVSAYDNGKWDLAGIGSSMAGAAGPLLTLGYADNSLLGLTTFDSQTVTSGSILVKYTYVGDANLDGVVNAKDLAMITTNGSTWIQGDFNYDGVVNADDFALFLMGAAEQGSAIQPAPEPAGLCLLASALSVGLIRRRR